tara:strand:- start:7922 stop:13957 length:6036 start_codon:yes stop_codon:yes gene_type:complete
MASSDDVLMRGMSGFRKEVGQPLKVPVEPGQYDSSVSDRYNQIREESVRPEYRGFTVPAGMDQDQSDRWFAAIDAREDERERKEAESFLTRKPEPWEGQFLEQMKALSLAASQEEQRFLRDPKARGEVYKEFAGEVYEDVMAGDPETIRNVADVSSLVDITGTSDVTSAVQSGRLAVRDPEQRAAHLTAAGISGVAGGIQLAATALGAAPLVGNLLSGARLKAAMKVDAASLSKAEEAIAASLKETTVVDDAGEPLRVYHGTPRQFDEFDTARMEGRTLGSKPEQTEGQGTYFTPSKASASTYAGEGGRVVEAFLDIKNPFIVGESSFGEAGKTTIRKHLETQSSSKRYVDEKMEALEKTTDLSGIVPPSVITAAMRADGFDGVRSSGVDGVEYVVFDAFQIIPTQGKQAIAAKDPVFESTLEKAAIEKLQNKTGVDAVISTLRSGGATKSEIADTKVAEFVEQAKAAGKKSITKDELIKHLDDNKVQIDEVRLSNESQKIPKDVARRLDNLNTKVTKAYNDLYDDAKAVARILAPGEDVTDQMHRFSDNSTHFTKLYADYVVWIEAVDILDDVPGDMVEIVQRLKNLSTKWPRSSWTPEDAALITEARNTINAKLADPEYKKLVDEARSNIVQLISDTPYGTGSIVLNQHENLDDIARALNKMPEAETRLAALRKFQASPKYQEYLRSQKEYKETYDAWSKGRKDLSPRWEEYTAPYGDNYQEILLTVPTKQFTELPEGYEVVKAGDRYKNLPGIKESIREKYQVFGPDGEIVGPGKPAGGLGTRSSGSVPFFDSPSEAKDYAISLLNSGEHILPDSVMGRYIFTESHHRDIPNVLVHIRTKDRIDDRGRKILFVEEIQSDWHQKGRSRGYQIGPRFSKNLIATDKGGYFEVRDDRGVFVTNVVPDENVGTIVNNADDAIAIARRRIAGGEGKFRIGRDKRVPDAPLKDTKEWLKLAINRIFREAADGGYDGVAFSRADVITPLVTLPPGEAIDLIGKPEAFLQRLENLKQRGGDFAEGAEQAEKVFKGNQYFYDTLIPSIAEKQSFVPPKRLPKETSEDYKVRLDKAKKAHRSNTFIDLDPDGDPYSSQKLFPFFELTDKVRDRVIKPQKLYSVALPGIAVGAAAAEEEELSAAAALGALGMGGVALYKGARGARAAGRAADAAKPPAATPAAADVATERESKGVTVYHGSPAEDITAFDVSRAGEKEGGLLPGISFSKNPSTAEYYRPKDPVLKPEYREEYEGLLRDEKRLKEQLLAKINVDHGTSHTEYVGFLKDAEGNYIDTRKYPEEQELNRVTKTILNVYDDSNSDFPKFHTLVPSGKLYEVKVDLQEPFVFDAKGDAWSLDMDKKILAQMREVGGMDQFDGVIIKNVYDGKAGEIDDIYVVFDTDRIDLRKPAATDVATAGAKTEDEAVEAARLWREMGTESPYFKRKFGNSKVVDEDGEVLPVFHGTSGDFNEFRLGSSEGAFGSAIYFSDNVDDVNLNYARAEGPDIKNRVENEIDRIDGLDEVPDQEVLDAAKRYIDEVGGVSLPFLEKAIKEQDVSYILNATGEVAGSVENILIDTIARKRVLGDENFSVMKTYVNIENPVYLDPSGTKGRTTFNLEFEYDEAGDIVDESGSVIDLLEAIDDVAYDFDNRTDAQKLKSFIVENSDDGEIDALDIYEEIKGGEYYFQSDTGGLENTEFIRQVFENMGFDGIIADAHHFFGPRRGFAGVRIPGMADVTPGTYHYMAFNPEQIKSATGNVGTFDPSGNILKGIGVGAAVPAAAAVRSQRQEEQGNPLSEPPEYEPMSYDGGYSQAIDFSETAALVEKMIGLSNEAQDLYTQMGLIEAEYASLNEEDKIGKRGKLLAEWYDDSADKFSEAGRQLDESEYDRYLMGSDTYYDTDPKGIQGYDDVRLFVNTGYSGDPMLLDADLRTSQENKQRKRLKETIGNGGPMLDMFGKSGDLNRYLYQKAKFFEHPVQTVQLNNDQKRILAKDYYNLEALKETGLISYLLYKELLGNVELV